MRSVFPHLLAVLCRLSVSCNRAPAPGAADPLPVDAVATIAGHPIRRADFEGELARRARSSPEAYAEVRQREELLGEMIEAEAVYLRAKEARFDQRPEIQRQIKRLIVNQFVETQLNSAKRFAEVTEAEVKKYYDEHDDQFATTEQAQFAVIFLGCSSKASPETRDAVRARANHALQEARALPESECAFGLLAQRYSEDQATRYVRGEAGWVTRGKNNRWEPEVINAVFDLKKAGDVAPVIELSNGFCLVKLMDRKEPGRRNFDEVKEAIRYQLAQEKREQTQNSFYQSMKAGFAIEVNQILLESIAPPKPSQFQLPRLPAS